MAEMKDIQKLIEERAINRLRRDLIELGKFVNEHKLLSDRNGPMLAYNMFFGEVDDKGKPKFNWVSEPLTRLFGVNGYNTPWGYFLQQLEKYYFPIYIEQESKEFLQKVDKLQEEVNYLLNNQPS